jgi:hypothetical protein
MGRLVFPLLVLLALPGLALGATYIVRPDGTGDFATIQDAIDGIEDGDIIELTDGTFTGPGNRNIVVNEVSLRIRSQSGDPRSCIIDCDGGFGGMSIWMNLPVDPGFIEGITFANGTRDWGGALLIGQGADLTVRDCIFSGNYSIGNGGAVMLDSGDATFIGCTFIGNNGGIGGALCT